MAKPIRALELHYPMIQFLIIQIGDTMKLDEVSSCSSNFCASCTDAVLKMSLQPSRKQKHERKKKQQKTSKTAATNDNFAHFYLFLDAFPCGR